MPRKRERAAAPRICLVRGRKRPQPRWRRSRPRPRSATKPERPADSVLGSRAPTRPLVVGPRAGSSRRLEVCADVARTPLVRRDRVLGSSHRPAPPSVRWRLTDAVAPRSSRARATLTLVYGGAHRGLMGVLADAMLDAGGRVIGVIPSVLVEREIAHRGLTELHVVETMHQRKAMMFELADAFVVAPGGLGTLEEAFEQLTGIYLGYHDKPDRVPRCRRVLAAARGVPRSRGRGRVCCGPRSARCFASHRRRATPSTPSTCGSFCACPLASPARVSR